LSSGEWSESNPLDFEILTVGPCTIGDESKGIQLVHKVLKRAIDQFVELRLQQPLDDPKAIPIILFPEAASWYDERVVERYLGAFTGGPVAQGCLIHPPSKETPVPMHRPRKLLYERILHPIEERRTGVDSNRNWLKFVPLASEIILNELEYVIDGQARIAADGGVEIGEDDLRRLESWFVDECFVVHI